MEKLRESLINAPVIRKGDYHYFVHPITDGIPLLEPELLREIVVGIIRKARVEDIDKIVAPEAMGIHIATAVSLAVDKPVVVIRKREYGLKDEVPIHQETGYSKNEMYINNIVEGDRVLLLDDVLSTGGTIKSICDALEGIGAEIIDVVAVIRKGKDTAEDIPVGVKSLIDVDVIDGEVVILDEKV